MATLEPFHAGTGEIAFELERFEFKADDRVEISGRWFGVRGRRFMRPTLTVVADGRGSRALADLEHKPWAPEDGKLWEAAFSCELQGALPLEAELNVAPDITITLPTRGADARSATKRSKRERPGQEPRPRERFQRQLPPRRSPRPPQESAARRDIDELKSAVQEANAEKERLQAELETVRGERGELAARIEELTTELDRAISARKSAIAARDQALAAHERSVSERDAAAQAHDEAVSARDAALRSRDQAIAKRDEALSERAESDAAANAALLARDKALAQRDAARNARERAVSERESLAQTADQLRSRHEEELASRGAQLVMRNATISSGAARHHAGWTARLLAVIVVLAAIVALLVVLRVF